MEILKFKTNIATESALAEITSALHKFEIISSWKIDTGSIENILSISGKDINPQLIKNALQEVGYQAELIRVLGLDGTDL
ncbi:MAG: copper chaperone [Adhaeribacter sp.]